MQPSTVVTCHRRRRVWSPTPEDVQQLSRSARQLARRSIKRMSEPAVAACLRRLTAAMALQRLAKVKVCDLIVELVDGHGLRAIDVARETGRRPADVSEMLKTARAFPPERRPVGVSYNYLLLATRMAAKFPELAMSPAQALDCILSARLSQHRDAGRYFAALARAEHARRPRLLPGPIGAGDFNRTYQCRFQELIEIFPNRSIALLHLDPPYLYGRGTYGSRAARSLACDGAEPDAAIQIVIDVLSAWQRKLAPNGVALVWQPWGSLPARIADAVETYRWKVWGPIVWDKGRPQPGNFASPYSVQGEMLWMLHRPGDAPINHDGSSRESILRFAPASFPALADRQVHAFEKPKALMKHLIHKHTRPGDLIFDACGCSGVLSAAAIDCGRRWVYAESNAANYDLGVRRIAMAQPLETIATG